MKAKIVFGKCETHGAEKCDHRHPDCYCSSLVESTCDFCSGTRKTVSTPETGRTWGANMTTYQRMAGLAAMAAHQRDLLVEGVEAAIGYLNVCHLANREGAQIKVNQAINTLKAALIGVGK